MNRTKLSGRGLFLLLTLGIGATASAGATIAIDQNWPQWRGPLQSGFAPSAEPPTTWSETNHIKWKVRIPGSGWSTPIIWGDRVFVQSAIPTGKKADPGSDGVKESAAGPPPGAQVGGSPGGSGAREPGRRGGFGGGEKPSEVQQFVVLCLDRENGKVRWQQVACEALPHEGYRQNEGSFASSSGVTDGAHYFSYFGSRGLYCHDLEGKLRWSRDLGKMRMAMGFGEGSSPALYKGTLIVNRDHEDGSFIVALDKETGKTLWQETRDERTSWSTPLIVEQKGGAQAIVGATGKVRSYDVSNGKVLWECGGLTRNVIPSPVAEQGVVYCMSGFQGNALLAIRLGNSGDLTGTDAILWQHKKSTPYVPSPLLTGDRLYFLAGNNGILSCFDPKTGQPFYEAERLTELRGVYASPVGAGGRVYVVGRNGTTLVLKDSDKPEVLATNRLEEEFEASPVIVGRELFLRGHEFLYCIAEK